MTEGRESGPEPGRTSLWQYQGKREVRWAWCVFPSRPASGLGRKVELAQAFTSRPASSPGRKVGVARPLCLGPQAPGLRGRTGNITSRGRGTRWENQEEAEIWAKFMAMGQAKGLEWARKMVAAQGAQQQLENTAAANTDEGQPSDSGLGLPSGESVIAPAKRKRPARATAGNKLKTAKKEMADSNLSERPSTFQKDGGTRRTKKDILEQESVGASGAPCTAGALATGADIQMEQEKQDRL
ncbi:hypothetical protein NDU88_004966 [Pleurodeles waltl]|uniref:Uncharacterized protein n=1 Tax=Pleurodeles waltl TaxID=8319 RepID=A0AAV7SKG2_PLEWA|nr:hypothetical protein NDU88_004966 [Pleurodeles waltl]